MKLLIKNGLVITMDEDRKEKFEKLEYVINDDSNGTFSTRSSTIFLVVFQANIV